MKLPSVITSFNNPQIKNLTLLQRKAKARKEQGLFVIEGIKMLEEARDAGILVKTYMSESFYEEKLNKGEFFKDLNYELIADSVFGKVCDTITPQGVIATVRKPEHELDVILKDKDTFLLLLEDIRDPGNLGTIIRTAEGAGVSAIILNKGCADILQPKVVRSTMGSIFRLPYYEAEDFTSIIAKLKEKNYKIFAAHLSGDMYDTEGSFRGNCGLLIGNEANGLSKETAKMADNLIKIPMEGKVESLNAAIAAAILMYEAARQRRLNTD